MGSHRGPHAARGPASAGGRSPRPPPPPAAAARAGPPAAASPKASPSAPWLALRKGATAEEAWASDGRGNGVAELLVLLLFLLPGIRHT
eukprot:12711886-Alexandrium_andersonii.AAC.1